MRNISAAAAVLALAVLGVGAAPHSHAQAGDSLVVLYTEQGILVIELFAGDAPNHAENFASLAEDGFYTGTLFHRIIPDFMIQGGDPNTRSDSGASPAEWGTGGTGSNLAAEFNDIMHNRGIVSMARSTSPDSASSQFFIVHQDSNFLDGQYTAFGRLATQASYDTLDKIAAVPTVESDRPAEPDRVKIIAAEVMTPEQARSSDLLLLAQNPPARMQSAGPPEASNGNYQNEELNLSVTFPEGWVVQSPGGAGMPDVAAVAPLTGALPSSIAVYVDALEGVSLDDVITSKVEDLQSIEAETDFEVISQETITLNGRDMFVLDAQDLFETSDGLTQIKYREVTAIVGDNIYSFLYVGEAANFDVDIALFDETLASFDVLEEPEPEPPAPSGGGCLIATAAFGSELAPQVQQLRELRDGSLSNTDAGRAFLDWFHDIYYSFSPAVADYQRENPAFRDTVRLAVTPMIAILSLLNHADVETDAGALAYGSAAISLVLLTYLGAPAAALYLLARGVRRRVAPPAPARA